MRRWESREKPIARAISEGCIRATERKAHAIAHNCEFFRRCLDSGEVRAGRGGDNYDNRPHASARVAQNPRRRGGSARGDLRETEERTKIEALGTQRPVSPAQYRRGLFGLSAPRRTRAIVRGACMRNQGRAAGGLSQLRRGGCAGTCNERVLLRGVISNCTPLALSCVRG